MAGVKPKKNNPFKPETSLLELSFRWKLGVRSGASLRTQYGDRQGVMQDKARLLFWALCLTIIGSPIVQTCQSHLK